MDELDKRLLNELQRNADQTMKELAVRLNSTPATVHRRIQRLKDVRVITRITASVAPAASHQPITVVLGIVIDNQKPAKQAEFRRYLRKHANIKLAWMTTGEFDYVAVCAFSDMAAYLRFLDQDLIKSVNFKNFRTFVCMDEIKAQLDRQF